MLAIQSNTNLTLQYQISTTSDYKDIEIRKIDRVSFCQIPENVALDFNS